jgi:hypothetical protein
MQIRLKRGFPWFPVVLAAGWSLMMVLTIQDLAWFANASPSFGRSAAVATASSAVPLVAMADPRMVGTPWAGAPRVPAAGAARRRMRDASSASAAAHATSHEPLLSSTP